ncbi:MAG: helix-turn-helix transcriptional regulator [Spirochaetes bacterium]|nr:helix-turn-helix transcriptional regulator [Spirochaetota bacterium]
METVSSLEKSICALEASLRISITVIDYAGIFHTPLGISLFPPLRQSHKKNAVCAAGFHRKCIAHCREAMNAKCQTVGVPFVETCWKGVVEIVVPLQDGGVHFGMLYAGSWRSPERSPPRSAAYWEVLSALPPLPPENRNFTEVLSVFCDGLMARLKRLNALAIIPDSRANQIRSFVRRHAAERISLGDISKIVGLSPSRTSAVVKETTGVSLSALINRERIHRVKSLLVTTEDRLGQIADATGFCDSYHLSKVFSKMVGMSPRDFRRRAMNRSFSA